MPRKPKQAPIVCDYFSWYLRQRENGVFYADGRLNKKFKLEKYSLNTRDREEALRRLRRLDLAMAIEAGIAAPETNNQCEVIEIAAGWEAYLEFCGRSPILGGVAEGSLRRYELVRDHHVPYCQRIGITLWNDFDRKAFEKYGNWLFNKFAYRTCYVDLTQIKSAVNWMIEEGLLPPSCRIKYFLQKPDGSDTYCYRREEVRTIIAHCLANPKLAWLGNIVTGLSHLGLRIGELSVLRWTDVDLTANVVRVVDERSSRRKAKTGKARTTKGRRSRAIPIHPELRKLFVRLDRTTDGRVFHAARGGIVRENNALKIFKEQVIQPLSEKFPTLDGDSGFQHGTFHSFRHFFCSQCFLAGASEGEIREWMGHRDSKVVELYRHLRNEDAQRRMENIDFLGGDDEEGDLNNDVA